MKLKLSTLFLLLTVAGLFIGWYCDRCRLSKEVALLAKENQNIRVEFQQNVLRVLNGTFSMAKAGITTDFLDMAKPPSYLNDDDLLFSDDDDFDLEKERQRSARDYAVNALEELSRNRDDVQYAYELMVSDTAGAINDSNWAMELARLLWEQLDLSTSDAFFELARLPKDSHSAERESLREMNDELVSISESAGR